ncbi:putative damage-inducible protein DinB [Filimonas zeae]|uniref:DinB-like domain-containing protein n=1 Tax=Filimonas zeae TaxID=1737353 RepID=A0A917IZF3_9BACT|nr:DinB family protein [Filimonas zeae]MDR6339633.1 putative damage-inducible protein DinB [Filimonas zeae]GGH68889.1 hypothetical protein GCM10011379_25630 [Filimonas zeae]
MTITQQLAKHLRDVHFGGNWTSVNLRDTVRDITWQQATTKVYTFNTIAALVYHIHYYVDAVLKVLQAEPLNAHDKFSFDVPPIQSPQEWEQLLETTWKDAELFAALIETLEDEKLQEYFSDEKYGNYFRNLAGIIEHSHYHLGQIVLIKKIVQVETPV